MNSVQRKLIVSRIKRARSRAKAHCQESVRLEKKNIQLGVPVVILTAVVGTSIFATLQKQPHVSVQIAIGLISISATVLSSLQTFLRYAEKSAKHRDGALYFENLKNELEQLLACPIDDDKALDDKLTSLRVKYRELAASYPNISERIWNAAVEYVEQENMSYPDV